MPGVVVKFDANPIRPSQQAGTLGDVAFCPCDFRCDFEEKVFAHDDLDGVKNDITDFLFAKVATGDSVLIELIRDGIVLATITDDTYGTYYDGFATNSLYVGWQADWTAIFNAFSGGRFQVKVNTTILGESTEFLSRYFRLKPFDALEANRTVKIETLQRGNLENSEFNFTDLLPDGWPTSIRIEGTFGDMQPTLDRDIYQDTSYREIQNRDTVNREYKLVGNFVPETIQNRIATTDLLGNEVFITAYDVLQERKFEKYPVVPESWNETRYDRLGRTYFEITFSDRQKNIIKTNVT